MAEIVAEVLGRVALELFGAIIAGAFRAHRDEHRSNRSNLSSQNHNGQLPTLPSPSSIKHNRAVLIASSDITFGNDCERLVNIAFETSYTFPSMMGTYADVIQYLTKELAKQHPNQHFHIIIGPNEKFGFSIKESQFFAEIVNDRYHILIFTTTQDPHVKFDTHDTENGKSFVWN